MHVGYVFCDACKISFYKFHVIYSISTACVSVCTIDSYMQWKLVAKNCEMLNYTNTECPSHSLNVEIPHVGNVYVNDLM